MPRVNGSELARRLREKHKNLVVLLISGADHGLMASPDFEVLPKPYNGALLPIKFESFCGGERQRTPNSVTVAKAYLKRFHSRIWQTLMYRRPLLWLPY